jgi:hypothetical protein
VFLRISFREVIREARADDIESFGKIFISTFYGISEAKAWLIGLGSDL